MGLADIYLGRAKGTVGSQVSSEGPALHGPSEPPYQPCRYVTGAYPDDPWEAPSAEPGVGEQAPGHLRDSQGRL